jgi:hypothetical protein
LPGLSPELARPPLAAHFEVTIAMAVPDLVKTN